MKRFLSILCLPLCCCCFTSCKTITDIEFRYDLAILVIVLISALFLILAWYSNILRDEVSDMDAFNANAQLQQQQRKWKLKNSQARFNLTKVQFGVWTVIISSVYIYLSLCKGDCADGGINQTALVLMGIFAGTAVAATIMDKKEINDNRPRHQNAPSEGFFIDILSDDNGISLHRFQNFAWTVIAMIVYLYKVSQIKTGCELPELSDTLLALTGISSATYLVLKNKENDPPIKDAQAANASNQNTNDTTLNVSPASNPVQP